MSLNRLLDSIQQALVRAGRERLRRDLLSRTDRMLEDCGFSRALLEQGVDAWPWRVRQVAVEEPARPLESITEAELARAASELRGYRDEELLDLGLDREGVDEAVRNGRPGIDDPDQRAA